MLESKLSESVAGPVLTQCIGGMAKWLTCKTSSITVASRVDSSPIKGKPLCSLEQDTECLLSSGLLQELIKVSFNNDYRFQHNRTNMTYA
jgi:hypothetical protein